MSVLESLRKGTDSAVVRVGMGVLFFAFIAFFANRSSSKSGDQSMTYATVNGAAITDGEVRQGLRSALGQRKKNPTDEEMRQIQSQVIDQLITQEALHQEAQRLGIAVSAEEIARYLKDVERFQKDGKFDEKTYEKALKGMDMSPARFETQIEEQLMYEKLVWMASSAVTVSDAEVKTAWREQGTRYTVTYVRLPTSAFLDGITVSDADRDGYIAKNGDKLKARYDESFDRQFNLPKTYTLHSILLRTDLDGMDQAARDATKARAELVHAQLVAGADFAELARRYSEDLSASKGGDIGAMAANQLDPTLAKAADETGAGKLSAVVETGRGYQIIRVDSIADARQIPFDEAKKDLAVAMLKDERVSGVAHEYASKVLSAWTTADAPPRELTEPMHLPVDTTPPFTLGQPALPALTESPEMLAAVKTARPGSVLPVPFEVKGTLFVVALNSREEPADSGYDRESGMVRAQLLYERKGTFLKEWVEAVKAKATVVMTPLNSAS